VGEEKALNVGPSGIEVAYERVGDPGEASRGGLEQHLDGAGALRVLQRQHRLVPALTG
jgi:hypothetical protein